MRMIVGTTRMSKTALVFLPLVDFLVEDPSYLVNLAHLLLSVAKTANALHLLGYATVTMTVKML